MLLDKKVFTLNFLNSRFCYNKLLATKVNKFLMEPCNSMYFLMEKALIFLFFLDSTEMKWVITGYESARMKKKIMHLHSLWAYTWLCIHVTFFFWINYLLSFI